MRGHLVSFFATASDLSHVIAQVEALQPLQFVRRTFGDTPDLDIATALANLEPREQYLVSARDLTIIVNPVPQRRGGVKYAIDQRLNPETVILKPGGLMESPPCLVAGDIGTISQDVLSQKLFNEFKRLIRKQFMRIQSFYVGPEAERLFDDGMRLTQDPRAPAFTDLQRHSESRRP